MTDVPDEIKAMAAIGGVCLSYSLLELTIAHVIWSFLDLDEDTGAIVTGGLDMAPRLNMAINLAELKNAPPPIKKRLRAVRTKLQNGLIDRRNQAVHGAHKTTGIETELLMLRWPKPKRNQVISVYDLAALMGDFRELTLEIDQIRELIGDWRFGKHRKENPSSGGAH